MLNEKFQAYARVSIIEKLKKATNEIKKASLVKVIRLQVYLKHSQSARKFRESARLKFNIYHCQLATNIQAPGVIHVSLKRARVCANCNVFLPR